MSKNVLEWNLGFVLRTLFAICSFFLFVRSRKKVCTFQASSEAELIVCARSHSSFWSHFQLTHHEIQSVRIFSRFWRLAYPIFHRLNWSFRRICSHIFTHILYTLIKARTHSRKQIAKHKLTSSASYTTHHWMRDALTMWKAIHLLFFTIFRAVCCCVPYCSWFCVSFSFAIRFEFYHSSEIHALKTIFRAHSSHSMKTICVSAVSVLLPLWVYVLCVCFAFPISLCPTFWRLFIVARLFGFCRFLSLSLCVWCFITWRNRWTSKRIFARSISFAPLRFHISRGGRAHVRTRALLIKGQNMQITFFERRIHVRVLFVNLIFWWLDIMACV